MELQHVADKTKNIAIHVILFYGDDRPIAKSRTKEWVDFVRKKRGGKWSPSEHTVICSRHFAPEDYTRRFDYGGQVEKSRLIGEEIGVLAVPRLMEEAATEGGGNMLTERAKRKVCIKSWQQLACCLYSSAKRVHKFFTLFSIKALLSLIQILRDSLFSLGPPYFVTSHHSSGTRSFSKGVAFSIALKFNNRTNIGRFSKFFSGNCLERPKF